MTEPKKARSEFCKGKATRLETTFNGAPAPGGNYYEASKHYVKACKNPVAGKHPHGLGYGGIDSDVFRALLKRGCLTIELNLAGEPSRFATFRDFLQEGVSVRWKDQRFPGPRRYLSEQYWYDSPLLLKRRRLEIQKEEKRRTEEKSQLGLWGGFMPAAHQ